METYSYFTDFLFTEKRALNYIKDKKKSVNSIMKEMVNRLQMMFEYKNLPETIPQCYLETYLLTNGQCVIAKPKGARIPSCYSKNSLYAFIGSPGGEPDAYYRPSKYMVSNPSLQYTNEFVIFPTSQSTEQDAVLLRNDTLWQGLFPLMSRYATLIAENLLTIRVADISLRVLALITAPNDKDKIAAELFLKKMSDGELGVIAENRFLDGIKMQNPPSNNGSYLTQFIELHQYLIGKFYNDIGLNSNYNMKREALSESETGLNEDSLPTLAENMLMCRKTDIEKVNELFGTNISIDFASSWKENVKEHKLKIKQLEAEIKELKAPMINKGDNNEAAITKSSQSTGMDKRDIAPTVDKSDSSNGEYSGNSTESSRDIEKDIRGNIGNTDGLQSENNNFGGDNSSTGTNITIIAANSFGSIESNFTTNTDAATNESNTQSTNTDAATNESNTQSTNTDAATNESNTQSTGTSTTGDESINQSTD